VGDHPMPHQVRDMICPVLPGYF